MLKSPWLLSGIFATLTMPMSTLFAVSRFRSTSSLPLQRTPSEFHVITWIPFCHPPGLPGGHSNVLMPFLGLLLRKKPQRPDGTLEYCYRPVRCQSRPSGWCDVGRYLVGTAGPSTTWLYVTPCKVIFVALILALSSSARYSASSLTRYLSGLAGQALLLLLPLLPGGGLGPLLLPVKFPWVLPTNETRMCHNAHVALGIFPFLWSVMRQTFGCLLLQLLAVETSPRRFTGQTFLCLALATCVIWTNGNSHHRSVDLAILTSLASLADFALLEVALALAPPLTLSSSMEVSMTALEFVLTAPFMLSS
jgi:hypothetical protein